jgi:hypothetical protein
MGIKFESTANGVQIEEETVLGGAVKSFVTVPDLDLDDD